MSSKLPVIESPLLAAVPHVAHGFFTRAGGVSTGIYQSLNGGVGSHDNTDAVKENRRRIAAHFGAEVVLVSGNQTHSTKVIPVDSAEKFNGDGAFTQTAHLALGVLSADCAPILLADKNAPVVAALHVGWRGAVGGIVAEAVHHLKQRGSQNLCAAIGPHISFAVYEVGLDMKEACLALNAATEDFFTKAPADKFRFDLGGYLQHELERCGVETERLDHCTQSHPQDFFSSRYARAHKQADYGRQLSVILLR